MFSFQFYITFRLTRIGTLKNSTAQPALLSTLSRKRCPSFPIISCAAEADTTRSDSSRAATVFPRRILSSVRSASRFKIMSLHPNADCWWEAQFEAQPRRTSRLHIIYAFYASPFFRFFYYVPVSVQSATSMRDSLKGLRIANSQACSVHAQHALDKSHFERFGFGSWRCWEQTS